MISIGNFFFRYRNGIFPLFYILLFVGTTPLFRDSSTYALVLGIVIAVIGQAIRALTIGLDYIIRGGKNRRVYAENLVTGGIFAHCRNPLYVGNFLLLLGVGVASNSQLYLIVAIPFFVFAYAAIIAAEENFLMNKFGPEFEQYCRRVNRVIPNFSGLGKTLEGMQFNWKRVLVKEYGTTFIWVVALLGVLLKNLLSSEDYKTNMPMFWTLISLLAVVFLAYATVRFLKKSHLLEDISFKHPSPQNLNPD